MSKGNILKDSFYKERLSRTSNQFIKTHQNLHQNYPSSPESDTEEQMASAQQAEVNYNEHLSDFGKTTCGTTYAFRQFKCTHKHLATIHKIHQFNFLEKIDLSFNSLKSLKYLTNLKFLTQIRATNNQITSVLEMKQIPNHLDYVDLSHNLITQIPELSQHKSLRVLKLNSNKITNIKGIDKNHNLRVLDLSENQIQQIQGLDGLELTELYLSNNQIETGKGLSKLQRLRVLHLSLNKIKKLAGFVNLVSLRQLNLAKNLIKHIRQIAYLENLIYLNQVDLSFNPLQQRKYYRLQVIYKLPMLNKLDGSPLSGEEVVKADSLYGLDVQEKYNIFKKYLTEQEFIDRRIHKSQLIQAQTDSDGDNNNLVDEYDDDGQRTISNNRYKSSKGFNGSKRSGYSKNFKNSKRSSLSKS